MAVVHIGDVIRIASAARHERIIVEIGTDPERNLISINRERIRFNAAVKKIVIDGGEGDDWIAVDVGDTGIIVRVKGGPGEDYVGFRGAAGVLKGGPGDDLVQVNSNLRKVATTVHGGSGNDELRSLGSADDIFYGGKGNDTLVGSGGYRAGDGKNLLIGGPGDDALKGARGNDTLIGGEGDDVLKGNVGDDLLKGGAGFDRFFGFSGDDVLHVSKKETYDSGSGNDQILD